MPFSKSKLPKFLLFTNGYICEVRFLLPFVSYGLMGFLCEPIIIITEQTIYRNVPDGSVWFDLYILAKTNSVKTS